MKNKKVKILSGICSALVAFGAVSPCGVNATEPTASMPWLGELSSLLSSPAEVDAYRCHIREDATVREIFDEIKSRGITKLEPEDFIESIAENSTIYHLDKYKLILYFILVDLLDLSCMSMRLDMESLNWANYSDSYVSKFFHCISDFINDNRLEEKPIFGSEFSRLNGFIKHAAEYGANVNVQDIYNYFSRYCQRVNRMF